MSKIYNEIVIDMNPESSTFEETLYEDSFEYSEGDMILAQGTTGHEGEEALIKTGSSYKYTRVNKSSKQESIATKAQYDNRREPNKFSYHKKIQFKVVKFQGGQWIATDQTAIEGERGMKTYDDIASLPSYVEGGETEWGAANISKDDFVDSATGMPLTIAEIYSNLDSKLPNITGEALANQIKDMMPKYQKEAVEKEKGFKAEEKAFAEREAGMGRQADLYGLQKETGKIGAQMRGAYGGSGVGMRGAIGGMGDVGKGFGAAQDRYGLSMDKAEFAERKGVYGIEKGAAEAYEADIVGAMDTDWFETPEGGAQVTEGYFGNEGGQGEDLGARTGYRKGGRVPKRGETFLDFLTQLPDAGGS